MKVRRCDADAKMQDVKIFGCEDRRRKMLQVQFLQANTLPRHT